MAEGTDILQRRDDDRRMRYAVPTRGAGVFVLSDHVRVRWHHRPKRQSGGGSRSRSRSRSNGCISADVRVLTPNGYRAIASITIGDSILSLGDKDSVLVPAKSVPLSRVHPKWSTK